MPIITIDGQTYEAREGQMLLDCCRELDIDIPTLCHHSAAEPYGSCRLCLVEVKDGRRSKVVTSCLYPVMKDGLEVQTNSEKVRGARRGVMELTLARSPHSPEVRAMAERLGVTETTLPSRGEDCIMCGLCARVCRSVMGRAAIGIIGRGDRRRIGVAYDRHSPVCMECGACATVCPVHCKNLDVENIKGVRAMKILKEFDQGLRPRSPIHIPYAQAVPGVPTIDRERCAHFLSGQCGVCKTVCKAEAIDFDQTEETVEIDVGAVVLAPGFKPFDPRGKSLGYKYQNVLTSLEFERVLSASGPMSGHVARPSDHKAPKRLAFVQCVGSRDPSIGHDYCSGVCCTYAIKEAIIAREHDKSIEPTIFFMDLRTHGKDFEKYYVSARDRYGVTFTRSGVSEIMEVPETGNLLIKHVDEQGNPRIDEFDMAVLSIGLDKAEDVETVAERMGVKLDRFGFGEGPVFDPASTTRPGVFAAGAFSTPMDIPETVVRASAAAAKASGLLREARGTLSKTKEYPAERDVAGEPPRVGVFVCHCGINIAGVVDVADVADYAMTLEGVVYAEHSLYTCSGDNQSHIRDMVREHNLNRVVVASCSPRTHEALFQETVRESGLNPYLFEMANIRDHCSWVHPDEPELATQKAKDLMRMAVAKSRRLEPLATQRLPVTKRALIVGGGLAGMTAALSTAEQGFEAIIVEKSGELGGMARRIHHPGHEADPQRLLSETIAKVEADPLVRVMLNAEVKDSSGFVGAFETVVATPDGEPETIEHGVAILATGGGEWGEPNEYMFGRHENVMTQLELEKELQQREEEGEAAPGRVVMIQCVGSREPGHQYCSRVCCVGALENALKVKERNPKAKVFILYRDLRAYGMHELLYQQAREKGVIFVRFDEDRKPKVSIDEGELTVRVKDPVLGRVFKIKVDRLVLSARVEANPDNKEVAKIFKVPVNEDGFFLEAHVKLRPVDMATEGVFVAGLAHAPKLIPESIAQAQAAAGRAAVVLAKDHIESVATISRVNPALCVTCGTCVGLCAYGAISKDEELNSAVINEALCKGCGACAASCRSGAIDVRGFTDLQMVSMLESFATR